MLQRPNTPKPLDGSPLPVQVKLAAAWTSLMFLYIYVDHFAIYTPGFIDQLRGGTVFEYALGEVFSVVGIVIVSIPALMIALSVLLPARVNRILNLVVAVVYIPVTLFNAVGETWFVFYGLTIGAELVLLAVVIRAAWRWTRVPVAATV